MVVHKEKKNKAYQKIPFHYVRAERSHMGRSFWSLRNNNAASAISARDKDTARW